MENVVNPLAMNKDGLKITLQLDASALNDLALHRIGKQSPPLRV